MLVLLCMLCMPRPWARQNRQAERWDLGEHLSALALTPPPPPHLQGRQTGSSMEDHVCVCVTGERDGGGMPACKQA